MAQDSVVTLVTRIVLFVVSGLTGILTARLLGPEGRGVYYLLVTYVGLLMLSGSFGLDSSNTYFGAKSTADPSSMFWNSIISGGLLGILMICVGWVLYLLFPQLFQGVGRTPLLLALFSLPWLMVNLLVVGLTLGLQHVVSYNVLTAVQRGFVLLFLLLLLPVWRQATAALGAHLVAQVIAATITTIYFARRHLISLSPRPDWSLLRSAFSYGMRSQAANILLYLNLRLATFVINAYTDPAQVGVYSIAVILAESLWHVSSSVATVLMPRVSASQSLQRARTLASRSARLSLAGTALLAVPIGIFSPWLISLLFGSEFRGAAPALAILLPGIVIFSVEYVLASYLAGRGYPQLVTVVAFIALVVTVVLNLWLVPKWGIRGAALASTISYAAATVSTILFYERLSGARLSEMMVPTNEDRTYLRAYLEDLNRKLARRRE
jgi:O-antigen/teichoic acid export membrane protein